MLPGSEVTAARVGFLRLEGVLAALLLAADPLNRALAWRGH